MLVRAASYGFIRPATPSPATAPPSGLGWIHEIKHDGYRHFHEAGELIFRHACKFGCEGIVSKRLGSKYRSGKCKDWLKFKNPDSPAVKREAEEDWGGQRRL
jgi:ATP-dependent DNA ligase